MLVACKDAETRTIGSNDGSTARDTLYTVYQDHSIASQSFMDEPANVGQMNQEVCIVDVLDGDAQMPVPRRRVVGRYGLASDRHYMADATFCEDPRRFGGVNPRGKRRRVSVILRCQGREKIRGAERDSTHVPRNNRPSMTGLMFLQVAMSAVSAVVRMRYRRPEPWW